MVLFISSDKRVKDEVETHTEMGKNTVYFLYIPAAPSTRHVRLVQTKADWLLNVAQSPRFC